MSEEPKGGWCTLFPEEWYNGFSRKKVSIKDCCFGHDSTCSTRLFYLCLEEKVGKFWATLIAFGGSIGCYIRYPKKMLEALKIKYNIKNKKGL